MRPEQDAVAQAEAGWMLQAHPFRSSAVPAGPLLLVDPGETVCARVARADSGPVPEGGVALVLLAAGAADACLEASRGGDHRVGVAQPSTREEVGERLARVLSGGRGDAAVSLRCTRSEMAIWSAPSCSPSRGESIGRPLG
jgi:hypothetical protein